MTQKTRTPTYDAFSRGEEEALHRLADGDDPHLVEAYARGVRAMAGRVRDRVANGCETDQRAAPLHPRG